MEKTVYELMHGEKIVADIGTNGICTVLDRAFLPFSIYLEDTGENDDLDIRMDNRTNQPVRLFDLMDLNQTFLAYDTIEGANCMTTGNRKISQREAAVEAVKIIGLNQRNEIKDEWFEGRDKERNMFWNRLEKLKEQ